MPRAPLLLLLAAGALPATACHAPAARPGCESASQAECPVCRHEGDLACVDVTVGPDTPSLVLDGRTYYFCSAECRETFRRHPERYTTPEH
jgi:YHS domain